MRRIINFTCVLVFLLTVYGCNKQAVKKSDLTFTQIPGENSENDDKINENSKPTFDKIHIELDKTCSALFCDIEIGDSIDVVRDKLERSQEKFTIGKDQFGIIQIWNNMKEENGETYILYFYNDTLFHVNRWSVSIEEIHKLNQFNEKFNLEQLKKYEQICFYSQNVQYTFMKDSRGFTISVEDLKRQDEISEVYDK